MNKILFGAIFSVTILVAATLIFLSNKQHSESQIEETNKAVKNAKILQLSLYHTASKIFSNQIKSYDELDRVTSQLNSNCEFLKKSEYLKQVADSETVDLCRGIESQIDHLEDLKSLVSANKISITFLKNYSSELSYNVLMKPDTMNDRNSLLMQNVLIFLTFSAETARLVLEDFIANPESMNSSLTSQLLKSHIRIVLKNENRQEKIQKKMNDLQIINKIQSLSHKIRAAEVIATEKEELKQTGFYIFGILMLVATFYSMWRIGQLTQLLKQSNAELDTKVKDRTFELVESQKIIINQSEELASSERLSAFGEMAAGVAHEINTPLSSIRLANSFVKRYIASDSKISQERAEKMANQIDLTIDRISTIITSLRKVSRNGETDEKEIVRLDELISDSTNICNEKFKNNSITLELDFDRDSLLKVQSVSICQVLVNLLNNAFHEIEASEEPWIKIKSEDQSDSKTRIMIIDSGSGIDDQTLEKIFKPFFTTKGVGVGTGLGLSISQKILKNHASELKYMTYEGNTCFNFDLESVNYSLPLELEDIA